MPAGDPAGYLPQVKRYRARKARSLGAAIKTSTGPAKRLTPKKPVVAKAARYTPDKGRTKKKGVYMPRPDGPLVGSYNRKRPI